ncbi:phospholipid carrier-dependent glycosyltransferase [Actinoplanes sp. NPDC048796]|uniref:ArnT family glycosyltransferase n=1 Tax=Actinoplanes sp. NPDC048796 TaxID=3155640 RepID=UPI0033E31005
MLDTTLLDVARPAEPRYWRRGRPWIYAGAALTAALALFTNVRGARDFDLDEVMYAVAGQNIAEHGSISWGQQLTAVHPPLHFLLLGLWETVGGGGSVLEAMFHARTMGALVTLLTVVAVGMLARRFTADPLLVAAAMIIFAVDAFVLRFGRTALIEPTAVMAQVIVVYLAIRLRRASSPTYIVVVGCVSGLALLVKEPLLFVTLVPLAVALLRRDWPFLRRAGGSLLVAAAVYAVFPIWAGLNGAGSWWLAEHNISAERLFGLKQLSGLNRTGVSSFSVFTDSFLGYAAGYLVFALGAAGLLHLVVRHGRRPDERAAWLMAFGGLSFGFLAYCVLVGQANEQLSVYSVVPAVLLTVLSFDGVARRVTVAVCVAAVAVSALGWVTNVALARDDATTRMGARITAQLPCVAVNATGNAERWVPVLPRNHVTAFRDGPAAVRSGVQAFLLSGKDSRLRYGNSSPELADWVKGNGRQLYGFGSRRYENIELWVVGGMTALSECANPPRPIAANASSSGFLALLFAVLALAAFGVVGRHRWVRRSI